MRTFVFICLISLAWEADAADLAQTRTLSALLVLGIYLIFIAWIIWRYRRRNAALAPQNEPEGQAAILVAYATQTGQALQVANKTVDSLRQGGVSTQLLPLNKVDAQVLARCKTVLFITSTTGEGDAPDNASAFVRHTMQQAVSLKHLQYGLLALGDASYTYFCGFGHKLDAWLQHAHAIPMFDLIEVDRGDDGALRHWQYQLGVISQNTELTDWQPPVYEKWRLAFRACLNPGGAGAPTYHLRLAKNGFATWLPGDIAEIGPRNTIESIRQFLDTIQVSHEVLLKDGQALVDALQDRLLPHDEVIYTPLRGLDADALLSKLQLLPHREYSIASTPQDGGIELLVRQTHHPDGRLGLGSGWLTQHAPVDGEIALRIRANPGFHPPAGDVPMILIGNGTGLAGLLSHLRARIRNRRYQNWLIFGERNAAHDFYFQWELESWLEKGQLARLDTAFSRDENPAYVQDKLQQAGADIVEWVNRGAAIYVCGSAAGMAPAVHEVLLKLLGDDALADLAEQGRYRRDIY